MSSAKEGIFILARLEKNIAVVCNPLAGAGHSVILAEKVIALLSNQKIPFLFFDKSWPADFDDYSDVWIVGGDGTLNYFVNHYPDINIPIVIFKGGSGNDFHWLLYGEISIEEQFQLVLSASPKQIDLGQCNNLYFINGVGVGFEGAVAKGLTGKKKKAGKASFMYMILKKIFSYRSEAYTVMVDNKLLGNKKYMIIDVSNGRRAGGGFHIAPQAKADDGLFDIVLINALHPFLRLRWLPVIEKGKHLDLSFIQYQQGKHIIIESDSVIEAHLDGEYYKAGSLEIKILPGKLLFRY